MSRISIVVIDTEHKKLKAMAALQGKSIKDFVIERPLGLGDQEKESALKELGSLLDSRIRAAKKGGTSKWTVTTILRKRDAR